MAKSHEKKLRQAEQDLAQIGIFDPDPLPEGDLKMRLPWPPTANHYTMQSVLLPKMAQLKTKINRSEGSLDEVAKDLWHWIKRHSRVMARPGPDAEAYHEAVRKLAWKAGVKRPLTGWLKLTLRAYPPDKRRRDLSNLYKMVEDSLEKAGVYEDDYQIRKHESERMEQVVSGGMIEIVITRML